MAQLPTIDARELAKSQDAIAIKSPEHLISWLQGSDRTFLIFHAPTLIRGLPWPSGVEALVQVTAAYNSERRAEETGWVETVQVPSAGGTEGADAPIFKDDRPWLDEIDDAIAQLQRLKAQHEAELLRRKARRRG